MNYRKIYEAATGKDMPSDFDVHHLDFNRLNNEIANLVAVPKLIHEKYHTTLNSTNLAVEPIIFKDAIPKFGENGGGNYFSYRVQSLSEYLTYYLEVQEWLIFKEFLLGNIKINPTNKSY